MSLNVDPERELADCYGYAAAWYYAHVPDGHAEPRLLPLLYQIKVHAERKYAELSASLQSELKRHLELEEMYREKIAELGKELMR